MSRLIAIGLLALFLTPALSYAEEPITIRCKPDSYADVENFDGAEYQISRSGIFHNFRNICGSRNIGIGKIFGECSVTEKQIIIASYSSYDKGDPRENCLRAQIVNQRYKTIDRVTGRYSERSTIYSPANGCKPEIQYYEHGLCRRVENPKKLVLF
ncbi:MAG: hypothetical protein MRY63_03170 [Neomegalonema sp.]|nr:hypothetical protein [Neomegalonema sp.]